MMSFSAGDPLDGSRKRGDVSSEATLQVRKVIAQFPDQLIKKIDMAAGELRTNRSAFLRDAAAEKLERLDRQKLDLALQRSAERNGPGQLRLYERFRRVL